MQQFGKISTVEWINQKTCVIRRNNSANAFIYECHGNCDPPPKHDLEISRLARRITLGFQNREWRHNARLSNFPQYFSILWLSDTDLGCLDFCVVNQLLSHKVTCYYTTLNKTTSNFGKKRNPLKQRAVWLPVFSANLSDSGADNFLERLFKKKQEYILANSAHLFRLP